MTIDQMRAILGLGPNVPDAEVVAAYAAYLGGQSGAPGTLPVSLDEAKAHLRIDGDGVVSDDLVTDAIIDAAAWVENYTGHLLTPREVTEHFRGVHGATLKAWPIADDAVFVVRYLDAGGVSVPVTGGSLDRMGRPARILPPYGRYWPFPAIEQAYSVTITAGYAYPADVPRNLRRAMLVMITGFYEDRDGGELFTRSVASAKGLCANYRWRGL